MRLLLDTHIALWAIADAPKLPVKAKQLIADPANQVHISAASVWEIAIKHALARGAPNDMPVSGTAALGYFEEAGYLLVGVSAHHAAAVESLPALHADPFDRLLVAQSLAEPFRLLTHDPMVASYSDAIILL